MSSAHFFIIRQTCNGTKLFVITCTGAIALQLSYPSHVSVITGPLFKHTFLTINNSPCKNAPLYDLLSFRVYRGNWIQWPPEMYLCSRKSYFFPQRNSKSPRLDNSAAEIISQRKNHQTSTHTARVTRSSSSTKPTVLSLVGSHLLPLLPFVVARNILAL